MARTKKKPNQPTQVCEWLEDDDGNWETSCDNAHVLNDGTPAENGMKFCCYCGRVLKQRTHESGKL